MAVVFIQDGDPAFISEGAGDDRYIVSALVAPNQVVTITDGEGSNTLQLEPGLSIASSSTTENFMVLTLSNGAEIRITNADNFTFITGPTNTTTGEGGASETFDEFVVNSLGLDAVPTGNDAVEGPAAVVVSGGGTDIEGDKTPEELYAEAIAEANDALADATAAQAAADDAEAAVVDQATAEAYKAAADAAKAAADAAKAAADNAAAAAANTADAADDAEAATAVAAADAAVATADAEVASADQAVADNTPNPGQTFTLTENADIIPGLIGSNGDDDTSGDDLIIAAESVSGGIPSNNLGSGDVLNPGDGFDTLRIIDTNFATLLPNSMNLERIDVQTPSFSNPMLNLNNTDGLEQLWHVNSDFGGVNTAFQSVGDVIAGFDNVGNTDPNNLSSTFMNINHMFDGVADGAVDIVTTNSNANPFVDVRDSSVDTVNIDSYGPGSILGLTVVGSDTPITMLNISGDGALDLNDFGGDHIRDLTMVNVTNTGGVDVDLFANDEDIMVVGGDGNDRFLLDAAEADGDDDLDGGAGDGDILALRGDASGLNSVDVDDNPDSPIVAFVNASSNFETFEIQPTGTVNLNASFFTGINDFLITDEPGAGVDVGTVNIFDAENDDTFTVQDVTGGAVGPLNVTAHEDADTLNMAIGADRTVTPIFLDGFDSANIEVMTDNGLSSDVFLAPGDETNVILTGTAGDGGNVDVVLNGEGTLDASGLASDAMNGPNFLGGDDAEQTIIGTDNDDFIFGNGGDDDLRGGDGDDLLDGGQSAAGGSTPDVVTIDLSGVTVVEGTTVSIDIGTQTITATASVGDDAAALATRLALEIGLNADPSVTNVVETAVSNGTDVVLTSPDTDPGRNLLDGVPSFFGDALDTGSLLVTQPIDDGPEVTSAGVTDANSGDFGQPVLPTIFTLTFSTNDGTFAAGQDIEVDLSVGGAPAVTITSVLSNNQLQGLNGTQQAGVVAQDLLEEIETSVISGDVTVSRVENVLTITAVNPGSVGALVASNLENGITQAPVQSSQDFIGTTDDVVSIDFGTMAANGVVTDNGDTGFEEGDMITVAYDASFGGETHTHTVTAGQSATDIATSIHALFAPFASFDTVAVVGDTVTFTGDDANFGGAASGTDVSVTVTIDEAPETSTANSFLSPFVVSLDNGVGNSIDFGVDTYTGGDGDDTFAVQSAEDISNFLLSPNDILDAADVITDFVDGDDLINFNALDFFFGGFEEGSDDNYSEGAVNGFGNITGALTAALSEFQADFDLLYSAQQVGSDVFVFASTGAFSNPIDVVQLTGVTLGDLSDDGSFLV